MLTLRMLEALRRHAEAQGLDAEEDAPERVTWLCHVEALDELIAGRREQDLGGEIGR